ncbi:GIY-YIG nuclease family protein [Marinomonas sp.]
MSDQVKEQKTWSVYIIQTRLNTLYTGITTDVTRRFKEHQGCSGSGAKYLKGKGPLALKWQERVGDKSRALKLEYRIKQLSRQRKLQIIAGQLSLDSLLDSSG